MSATRFTGIQIKDTSVGVVDINASGSPGSSNFLRGDGTWAVPVQYVEIGIACSDETATNLTAATAVVTFRSPYAFTVTSVRASLTTASSGGDVVVDINESGTTILSTKLSIDDSEKTSTTAATPAVISDASIANDAEITIDIDSEGSFATGLKVWIIGHL